MSLVLVCGAGANGRRPARRRRAGFTLVELLVVVVILALLVAVMAPNFQSTRGTNAVTQVRADLEGAATALESGYARRGNTYPATGGFVAAIPAAPEVRLNAGSTVQVAVLPDGSGATVAVLHAATGARCQVGIGSSASAVPMTCNQ